MSDEETNYKRIYNLIDQERKERISDISEIHSRIDQVLNAIQGLVSKTTQNAGPILALFATVVISMGALLGFSIRAVNTSTIERYIHAEELSVARNDLQAETLRWLEKEQDTLKLFHIKDYLGNQKRKLNNE